MVGGSVFPKLPVAMVFPEILVNVHNVGIYKFMYKAPAYITKMAGKNCHRNCFALLDPTPLSM